MVHSSVGADYEIRDLQSDKLSRVHVKRLRAFVFDKTRIDPATVVAADRSEFLVDYVLDHLPKENPSRRRRELRFKIRWVGYGLLYDTWEPWSELRANDRVHAYMRANGMGNIISPLYAPSVVAMPKENPKRIFSGRKRHPKFFFSDSPTLFYDKVVIIFFYGKADFYSKG